MRDPWGSSAYSAVRWAFAQLASVDNMPSVLGDLRTGSKPKRELERLELRAQAALIRGMVERLEPPSRHYLTALYLPRPQLEKQAGGVDPEFVDRFHVERAQSVHEVAWWLMAQQGSGQHRIRGYREIVAQHVLSGNRSLDRIRALMKMDMNRVGEKRKECEDMLKDLSLRSHAQAEDKLTTCGVLEVA